MVVQTGVELLPGVVDGGLVQEPVYDVRVVPVRFVAAVLVVASDMIKVTVPAGEKGGAESTGPGSLALRVFDDVVGMGACGTAMCILVMLVEGVGAPKNTVAARAGIALIPLVEFILVSLPVKLALESHVAKRAPECPR